MQPFQLLWEVDCGASIISVAATPNFSTICAATVGRCVYLFDGEGHPVWRDPYEVDAEAWAVAISDDGLFVAVGTANKTPADGTLYVLSRDRRLIWSKRIRAPIWSVSLSTDGEMLIASTWGVNKLFLFSRTRRDYIDRSSLRIDGSGLYGAKLTKNGQLALVASYESGLYLVDQEGTLQTESRLAQGLYNVAIAHGANAAFIGTRDGTFLRCKLDDDMSPFESAQISQRPICGISATDNGLLVAAGSFDGSVIVATGRGQPLWSYQTKGEVWSTAMSATGSLVCAGGGDHKLVVFQNLCDTSAYQEISALECALAAGPSVAVAPDIISSLLSLYLKYRLAAYGNSRLTQLLHDRPEAHTFRDEHKKFLEATVSSGSDGSSHYFLAQLLADEKRYLEAICHFQLAARTPELRSSAHRRAAECFTELRLNTAATSAWRQSREQHLDDNARNVLYTLARSYEDAGGWREAAKIYEMILSWDADFRNSWDRLSTANKFRSGGGIPSTQVTEDYTGATVSLLGPDAPRQVDDMLRGVVEARSREISIESGDRERVQHAVAELLDDDVFSSGVRRDVTRLSYSIQLFLKYDFGLPEDELKKFLETVTALPNFRSQLDARPSSVMSLDIGSATGRYPLLLRRMGFNSYGVDIEQEAITYSIEKAKGAEWPRFICGDARKLDSIIESDLRFRVITCMMGTFEHIPKDDQPELIAAMCGRLEPGGVVVISVWDVECPHLAYLSIYGEEQKELIRQNSRTHQEMRGLFENSGLVEVDIVPFCLLPQSVIYDLGIDRKQAADISIAARADLAARALFNERHGEMFLAIGRKPSAVG